MARDTTKISSAAFEYSAGHTILRLVSIKKFGSVIYRRVTFDFQWCWFPASLLWVGFDGMLVIRSECWLVGVSGN